MRGQHVFNAAPLKNRHVWTFHGHDLWVEFARHSKASLILECFPFAREPQAHLSKSAARKPPRALIQIGLWVYYWFIGVKVYAEEFG